MTEHYSNAELIQLLDHFDDGLDACTVDVEDRREVEYNCVNQWLLFFQSFDFVTEYK